MMPLKTKFQMKDYIVPIDVQMEIEDRVRAFNTLYLNKKSPKFCSDARGRFIYLLKYMPDGSFMRLGRLTYKKGLKDMDFAIFKYSKGRYVLGEKAFPGAKHLDGTIEGTLKALQEAYPLI